MYTNGTFYFLVLLFPLFAFSCSDNEQADAQSECPDIILSNYEEEYPNDYILINSVSVQEQELNLNVSHSGGCEEHEYQLIQDPLFCGTAPIYIAIHISHNNNNDLCEAWITKDICFNISPIYDGFPNDVITIGLYNTHQTDTTWVIE